MTPLTDQLWVRYRTDGDPRARSALLDGYLGLVHHSARELMKHVPSGVELDDLVSAGTLGLVQALEGFDPGRGLAFSTYAIPRIRGAMLDELRGQDWMPRTARARGRQIAQARATLQQKLGRGPEAEEMATALGIDLETYWRWAEAADHRVMVALDQSVEVMGGDELKLSEVIRDPDAAEPGDAVIHAEAMEGLRVAFETLAHKERTVLALYYYEELNLREIGEVLHVTESRVSQIRTRALKRLRETMNLVLEEQ